MWWFMGKEDGYEELVVDIVGLDVDNDPLHLRVYITLGISFNTYTTTDFTSILTSTCFLKLFTLNSVDISCDTFSIKFFSLNYLLNC